MTSFNLEEEYSGLLDLLETYIAEENPSLKHYGVKGMKWGIRKSEEKTPREPMKSLGPDSISRKTSSGETITLRKMPPTKLHNLLGRMSKRYREEYESAANLDILDSSGKKVGDAIFEKKSDKELYINWVGVDQSARGKGYATAVMKAARDFGKQQNFEKMTLEVPGNSPDARHIYEKLGFKVTKEADTTDDFWGGLTEMEYEFKTAKHGDLTHYGVKGMKWGVRKARTGDIAGKTARLDRVASGKGTVRDHVVTTLGMSNYQLARAGGYKNAAARKSENLKGQSERLAAGEARVSDLLKAYGTVSTLSLARALKD